MNDLLTAMVLTAPIVVALVQGIKLTGYVHERFNFPLALGLGVLVASLFPPSMSVTNEIASGILAGLSASGLWSGGKAMAGK